MEYRYLQQTQVRAVNNAVSRSIRGLAIVFNSRSENLGGFTETIDPGALDGADMSEVVALFNHNATKVLGRTTAGTLRLTRTAAGLAYEIDLPDTQVARDLYTSITRGDVRGSSFAFRMADKGGETWKLGPGGIYERRVIKIAKLLDVSPVLIQAYKAGSVSARRQLSEPELMIRQRIQLMCC